MSKYLKIIFLPFILIAIASCSSSAKSDSGDINLSERESFRYDEALANVENVENLCDQLANSPTKENMDMLLSLSDKLEYDYNDAGMNQATIAHCDSLKVRIEKCKQRAQITVDNIKKSASIVHLLEDNDRIITESVSYPFYVHKGETLIYSINSDDALSVNLYNAGTERLIKSYSQNGVTDSISISNAGIYELIITPSSKQYVNVALSVRPSNTADAFNRPNIISQQVECNKNDIGAVPTSGIKMRKCFDEPRKFTLRGQIKAAFSGNAKALVPVQVPAGATDILYSLRIATSEGARSEDGKFHDNLSRSYTRIKFLNLPLYEKSSSNGLINTLLDDNRPIREEDAYCNMYVFRNQTEAKKFQDGTAAATLDYDIDSSTIGTQSCNGRIPAAGSKTIYLGFENERMRYTNYIWIEVEAVFPETVYHKTKYKI